MTKIQEFSSTFECGGKTITLEHYEPAASGQYPALLVLHGSGGMGYGGSVLRDVARHLAAAEYVALIPHFFERTGTRWAEGSAYEENFLAWMETVAAALEDAARQPKVDARRLGLLGFSLGGYLALSVAALDPRVAAVVELSGGMPDFFATHLKRMPPTLIVHGAADDRVPVEEAHKLERLLQNLGVPYEMKIYPRQGHGFSGPESRDAEQRTLRFFEQHLKKGAKAAAPKVQTSPRESGVPA